MIPRFTGKGYINESATTIINTIVRSIEQLCDIDFPDYTTVEQTNETYWTPTVEGEL